jgi:cytidyltransferase-like protein
MKLDINKDNKMRYSMFVGRFQPFHDGHKWLIEQRLKLGKKICIAVMDIHDTEPEKNPYRTEDVILNIETELQNKVLTGSVKVISIPPIESVNYGRDVGYDIIEHTPPLDIKEISATKIREKNA